jgi:SAM-dependent methyltransferase
MIDYDAASGTYDNTRGADEAVIRMMEARGAFSRTERPRVLDFGCGTGNYLRAFSERFDCELVGLEPSDEMRAKALSKNPGLRIEKGDHACLPFEDGTFDLIYMNDVIHHVPDLDLLFEGIAAKLAAGALACVATESWEQIEARWYNRYFPSLAGSEKARYPDLGEIAHRAAMAGLDPAGNEAEANPGPHAVDDRFLRMVGERNYSMFRLLSEDEYEIGCAAMRADRGRTFMSPGAGQTLVWLSKGGA